MERSVETAVAYATNGGPETTAPGGEEATVTPSRKKMPARPESIVIYDHASLEDADLRVLGPATVSVAASAGNGHKPAGDVTALRPTAVVTGEEALAAAANPPPVSIDCGQRGSITLVLWLADAVVAVECKRLVLESITDCWVERVRDAAGPASLADDESGIEGGEEPPAGQRMAG